MTYEQALQVLIKPILKRGEITDGSGCLSPSDAHFPSSKFGQASDFLYEEYDATHFSRVWVDPLKSVKVTLYAAEAFGACITEKVVHEVEVEVNSKYFTEDV